MRKAIAAAAALIIVPTVAWAKTEERRVDDFDQVSVEAGIHAVIAIGGKSVEVTADDDVLGRIVTEVDGGTLRIGFQRKFFGFHFNGGEITVRVRTPKLSVVHASGGAHAEVATTTERRVRLGASGGGEVRCERSEADEAVLEASGGGTVRVGAIEAARLHAEASGGGTMHLSGRAERAELEFSGGGVIDGKALQAKKALVDGSGGGDARLTVQDAVKGSLSGGASLTLGGNPRARVTTSGGGSVHYADGHRGDRDDDED